MKLQKSTWALLATALILSGVVYVYEFESNREAVETQQQQLFSFEEEDIQAITIQKQNQIRFERSGKEPFSWQMQPQNVPANDAAVSFLLDLLVQGKSDRSFTISPNQKSEYGLNQPSARIQIELKNQEKHELILGNTNFDNQFIYAQVDPPKQAEQLTVNLVSINFQYAVDRELEEWKQPNENGTDLETESDQFKTK